MTNPSCKKGGLLRGLRGRARLDIGPARVTSSTTGAPLVVTKDDFSTVPLVNMNVNNQYGRMPTYFVVSACANVASTAQLGTARRNKTNAICPVRIIAETVATRGATWTQEVVAPHNLEKNPNVW